MYKHIKPRLPHTTLINALLQGHQKMSRKNFAIGVANYFCNPGRILDIATLGALLLKAVFQSRKKVC